MEKVKPLLQGVEMDRRTVAVLAAASCGLGAAILVLRRVARHREAREKIQRARDRRTESLQLAEAAVDRYKISHPTTDCAYILSLSLSELTEQLRGGSLSPEDVLYTFMEKTLDVNKKLNCCTGVLLESFAQLKTLNPEKKGLLYGVPVSIKENVAIKDHDCSCGVVINLDQPLEKDSVLVEVLKKQGAIPFVKTNFPQALLNYECSNPIFGRTVNPQNLQKTSGGSSGGEGALIGAGGSLLGLGTDIGGSIRIPAAFCGICGIKATAGRLSTQGVRPIHRGQKSVLSCPGPLASDVDSLALFMQAVMSDYMFELDPTIPPVPFNMEMYQSTKPLRIGYFESHDFVPATPAMARTVREVKVLLERAGHTLVPYTPLRVEYVSDLLVRGILADGATTLLQKLDGSPLDPCMAPQVHSYAIPLWLKKLISFLIKPVAPRVSFLLGAICGVRNVVELWEQHTAVEDFIQETIEDWRRYDIDVMLCPMFGPAFNPNYCSKLTTPLTYTMLYNLLTFPAGVVTVTKVTEKDEADLKHYSSIYRDHLDQLFKQATCGGVGLPMAVQCVALPWQDELCLRFMKEVERVVKQSKT